MGRSWPVPSLMLPSGKVTGWDRLGGNENIMVSWWFFMVVFHGSLKGDNDG